MNRQVSLYRVSAAVLALAVLVQAALAGQFLTANAGALAAHRYIGEAASPIALVVAALGFRIRASDRDRWWLGVALVVMVVAQTGLGFAGRESTTAASLHVPVGVVIFGAALVASLPRLRT